MELYLHFPNTPSWRGAQLKKKKHRNNFAYTLLVISYRRSHVTDSKYILASVYMFELHCQEKSSPVAGVASNFMEAFSFR